LARCFPLLPDAWFRTLWLLVRLVKEDRRAWHQMTPADFAARGTFLKESAQREAIRELVRVNLVVKCEAQAESGGTEPNWLKPNIAQDPVSVGRGSKKGDPRPMRTPAAEEGARSPEGDAASPDRSDYTPKRLGVSRRR